MMPGNQPRDNAILVVLVGTQRRIAGMYHRLSLDKVLQAYATGGAGVSSLAASTAAAFIRGISAIASSHSPLLLIVFYLEDLKLILQSRLYDTNSFWLFRICKMLNVCFHP